MGQHLDPAPRYHTAGSFVGRAESLAHVEELLARERLVSVVGPPGIGKSRLGHVVAARAAATWSGGAVVCELASAMTAEHACESLAAALGVALTPASTSEPAWRRIGGALSTRGQTLVLLDNFEQLASLAHAIVGPLLAGAPEAHLLVTTRERLRVRAEVVHELEPLGSQVAVELLLARAAAAGVRLEGGTAALTAIAARLDGLPLALELAAARLTVMTPEALLIRLDRRFDVLTAGVRDAAPRHATLRAAIDWSWELLSPDEQATLMQLCAFRSSFALDAAEAVVQVPGNAPLLDAIQALVEKSLVRAPAPQAPSRFALLESIAEYSREKLEVSGQAPVVTARHATWYAAQALVWADAFDASGEAAPLERLAAERDNLEAAAQRALEPGGPGLAAALAAQVGLEALAAVRGRSGEASPLDEVLRAGRAANVEPRLVARALIARAAARRSAGKLDDAVADCLEAEAVAAGCGDQTLAARATLTRAIACQHAGHAQQAAALLERALACFEASGNSRLAGFALGNLAFLRQAEGHLDDAEHSYAKALAALSSAGHRRYLALFSGFLGTLRCEQGRFADARALFAAACAGLDAVGDRRFSALFVAGEAAMAAALGLTAEAAEGFARAQALLEAMADTARLAVVDLLEGFLDLGRAQDAERAGDPTAAEQCRASAGRRLRNAAHIALAERSDEVRFAARVLAGAVRQAEGVPREPHAAVGSSDRLAVASDGSCFVPPGGSRAELTRHRALRLLLTRLVEQRLAAPGVPLSLTALIDAGWPGERVIPHAGANRVYVALSTLRKLGLSTALVRTAGGYLLDPAVEIETLAPGRAP